MPASSAALRHAPTLRYQNVVPVIVVAVMAAVSLVWNRWDGIEWRPALPLLLAAPAACFAIAAVYSAVRPARMLAEGALYVGLWLTFPIFGTRLTYLANAAGLPLKDKMLAEADAALGFHWIHWAQLVVSHPVFASIQDLAYESYFWQPILSVGIFALWGPRTRNCELLTSMLLALLATIAISTFFPAIGPAEAYGYNPPPAYIIQSLRYGFENSLPYVEIVSFPSFHTVMAILFADAHRGNWWSFPAFLTVNLLMLISIPYGGDHYLIDMIGGAAVAGFAIVGTRRFFGAGFWQQRDGQPRALAHR